MINYLEINNQGVAVGGIYNLNPRDTLPDNWIEIDKSNPSIGWTWDGTNWKSPKRSMESILIIREDLLRQSDWRDLPSYPGSDQEDWRLYRQDLRDIPQNFVSVDDVIFPDKPI